MKWVLVVVLAGCFVTPVMPIGGGKTRKQALYDHAAKMTPPGLVVDDEVKGDVRTAKIRVWADDEFRAQNVRWQQTFEDILGHANEILAGQFGIRFVAEYRSWSYRAEAGSTLASTLSELAAQDPGSDVFGVVGLTSALALVSEHFEALGVAHTPGRHMMLRGFADVGERAVFDRAFHELRTDERENLYKARRRHKTVAVFLHELAHNLGCPHRSEPDTLMSPNHSYQSTSFDLTSRSIMQTTIDQRLGRTRSVAKPDAHPTLVVEVDAAGNRSVGGNVVDDATLDGLFRLSFNDDKDTAIVVKAKDKAPQSVVLKVVDRAKAAGLQRISVGRD